MVISCKHVPEEIVGIWEELVQLNDVFVTKLFGDKPVINQLQVQNREITISRLSIKPHSRKISGAKKKDILIW